MATTPAPVLLAPGTPAVTLPKYSAPAFANPSVPIGGVITSVTFEDAAPNSPFTFGQVFKQGDLAPSDGITGRMAGVPDIPLQVDVKATHKDGSVRHAIISGVTSQNGEMFLLRAAKNLAPTLETVSKGVDITIVDAGVEYHAFSWYSGKDWLAGPIAHENIGFEPLVNADNVPHPFLTVQINERVYVTGQTKFDVVVEHTNAWKAVSDITYDIEIRNNNTVTYSKTGQVHFPCSRYKIEVWEGAKPSLHVKHNTAYLIATKAVPNYDQTVKVAESTLVGYEKALNTMSFGPMAIGRFMAAMATTGGRPDIGLMPDVYAATILSMDKRAKALTLASGNVGGSWAGHRRLDDGSMLDIVRYPYATTAGNLGDTLNPKTKQYEKLPAVVTSSKLYHDASHQPAFAYIPYLLTGDYFYLEELQFWCNYNMYFTNPYYRMFEKGWVKSDQLRGQGWSLRTLAEAAYITPDDHQHKANFQYWLDCNMEFYRINYTDAKYTDAKVSERSVVTVDPYFNNDLGLILNGPTIVYNVNNTSDGKETANGISFFMDDHFTSAVGHAYDLGCEEAGRLLKWKAKCQVERMIAEGWCPNDAVIYSLRIRKNGIVDSVTKQLPPIYKTYKECRDNTKFAADLGCPEVLEMSGYPDSPEGFPSNYQPALAYCVDSGYLNGHKAWKLFMSRKTKPNYGLSPQFAIVPRTSEVPVEPPVIVTPPTETPPPVVVEPPPVVPPVVTPPADPVVPPVEPPKEDPVTPPTEPPPVVVPPVVVPPVVEPPVEPPKPADPKLEFNSPELENKTNLTVLVQSGERLKAYISSSTNGTVTIVDNVFLVKSIKYSVAVYDEVGFDLVKISPVKAI